jgi:hypothetical protein
MFNTNIVPGMPLNVVHPEYAQLGTEQKRQMGLDKLNAYIARGKTHATQVVRAILEEKPRDRYIRARALEVDGERADGKLGLRIQGAELRVAQHALDQAAARAGMNLRHLHDLQGMKQPWATALAARNMNELLQHAPEKDRFLVRDVDGLARGIMSDAYKRRDSAPILDAIIGAAQTSRAMVVDGIYTETRVSLKVVKPEPIEVFPGEWMSVGLDFSNSDYGDGKTEFSLFLLRLLCLNGAVTTQELSKVHLGRRWQGEDGIASDRTLELDAQAQISMAQDMVRALLSPAATDNIVGGIRRAAAAEVGAEKIEGYLKTRVNKTEAEAITTKFASADVIELPPGQNAWRLSNAISWLARETVDGRRKMDLERLAGDAMTVKG